MATWGWAWKEGNKGKWAQGTFWKDVNVIYLDWSGGYMGIYTLFKNQKLN